MGVRFGMVSNQVVGVRFVVKGGVFFFFLAMADIGGRWLILWGWLVVVDCAS